MRLGILAWRGKLPHVLGLSDGVEAGTLHIGADLIGNFLEHLLGKISSGHGLIELDELDDIAGDSLACRVSERTVIAIQLVHHREVCITDSNDNDGAREGAELINQVLGLWHVMDGTIGQDEQDLVLLSCALTLEQLEELTENRSK